MTQTVLILGATGRFGRHAAQAFEAQGWQVRRFNRDRDDLARAVQGVDVVVNGWNPPDYTYWKADLLPMHRRVIDALTGTNATVILPGNLYVFGPHTPAPWGPNSAHAATNPLALLRKKVEDAYRASGIKTILIRSGDFLDTQASGNWFDALMVTKLSRGVFTYPGNVTVPHAWAYLPDVARAAAELADKRRDLPVFSDISFSGYTLSGQEITAHLQQITGQPLKVKHPPWTLMRLAQPFVPWLRGLCEMRYIWNLPHWLEKDSLNSHLPDFTATPIGTALRAAIAHTGAASPGQVNPNETVPVQL